VEVTKEEVDLDAAEMAAAVADTRGTDRNTGIDIQTDSFDI